jgi:hypothetical protein
MHRVLIGEPEQRLLNTHSSGRMFQLPLRLL